jgi:hypothetical protein
VLPVLVVGRAAARGAARRGVKVRNFMLTIVKDGFGGAQIVSGDDEESRRERSVKKS